MKKIMGIALASTILLSMAIQPTLAMEDNTMAKAQTNISINSSLEMKLDQVAWEISTWPLQKQMEIRSKLEMIVMDYRQESMVKTALTYLWWKVDENIMSDMEGKQNIAQIAMSANNMTHLVAALQATNLAGMFMMDDGMEYTVLAPTDEAFEKLAAMLGTTVNGLWEDTDTLTEILQYHVMVGTNLSTDVVLWPQGTLIDTAGDEKVRLTSTQNGVMFDNATVIKADIKATNGVIHVIDTVLLPPTVLEKWNRPTMRSE
jgi:uncharacterized surface protein with fasciclin (FAS1) repeats